MTLKRIHREIADVQKEDMGNIKLAPTDNLLLWKGSLPGPESSVYEGGSFDVDIVLAHDYPFTAPRVVFKTRIYHMNISDQGNICIDILKNNWSPALSLFKVMLSLSSLLTDPNPKDPLVPGIATQYVQNRKLYDDTARRWTQLYARPEPPPPVTASSLKGKEKQKAPVMPVTDDELIVISDDDSPERRRRKREASVEADAPSRNKRRTRSNHQDDVIVIEDD
ncbi:uncharacterized protein BT62DRAFT_975811 [Guyanagaster necrorhizus]|uniref:E2 ubiquitin-conjugating enzyme n=1 Tax=Guyanagaster necrorhizus TaxID=856835 RepID=A0A9P7VH23_9AGAR|nr:uncharacterized protein BT62DRAFT_975811 [Guyanagaster necrorhizus MCA 3950]KAG7440438.1 hypothetical protein BT62DRAFT_975811 [Guyanagaster necrorhizus MCA 3950]